MTHYTKDQPLKLRDETSGEDHRSLWAYLDEEGNLHIDGQDLGPGTAIVSSDGEYEWFQKIKASDIPALLTALGESAEASTMDVLKNRFTGSKSYDLETVLRTSGIPVERFVWSG